MDATSGDCKEVEREPLFERRAVDGEQVGRVMRAYRAHDCQWDVLVRGESASGTGGSLA